SQLFPRSNSGTPFGALWMKLVSGYGIRPICPMKLLSTALVGHFRFAIQTTVWLPAVVTAIPTRTASLTVYRFALQPLDSSKPQSKLSLAVDRFAAPMIRPTDET